MADTQASNGSELKPRSNSISQASESSQTAAEFIKQQLSLEAEAREALPYQFDTCTRDLGAIRQSLFSCLTCNPPPTNLSDPYTPAGVCYSCSISCHGEHTLVELFNKRNFVCDCGTTRLPETSPCTLRVNVTTGQEGRVTGEEPARENKYNQNFRNRFCGCSEEYDPHQEKGTMFQCLGLGTVEEGGCGEDWYHPECVVGLSREEYKKSIEKPKAEETDDTSGKAPNGIVKEISLTREEEPVNGHADARRPSIVTAIAAGNGVDGNDLAADVENKDGQDDDPPLPPGFPQEDDFDCFLCYKCVEAFPWIKRYAGAPGFLSAVYFKPTLEDQKAQEASTSRPTEPSATDTSSTSKKRKAEDEAESSSPMAPPKRQKSEDPITTLTSIPETTTLPLNPKIQDSTVCKLSTLPANPTSSTPFSLFLEPDFRDHLCRCTSCFPLLKPHPQLLEEEDTYEPPISEDGDGEGAPSVGTGSLLDRGEAAFSNMDRVRAIEGAMVYAQLKDKVKAFLQPFADSGQAVGAEDIKAYFEKLRGDEAGIKAAAGGAGKSKRDEDEGSGGGDNRKEQSGY
ncbi:hypothetical protein K469DRAFT_743849 [Zopfia rhizophila CBS 207.26]|uniref:UBR-type domain-containing protein n=1 Tax=Zopfia rhizophila CBS 207.26 TaxID=1314779 RepID=A0A6A6EW49_9PEZI|nr:hypothetical protein K469DRAFT_743849 [Zopfia rhizophila CBS 207.26]